MTDPQQPQPSEEEVRAALEEQLRQLTVDDMLLESAVSLINLGGRKAGVAPGTEDERDLDQVRRAVDAVRALLPLLEQGKHAEQLGPLRDALARLQMAYAQTAGQQEPPEETPQQPKPQQPKPRRPRRTNRAPRRRAASSGYQVSSQRRRTTSD
jgi:hypothetical protein